MQRRKVIEPRPGSTWGFSAETRGEDRGCIWKGLSRHTAEVGLYLSGALLQGSCLHFCSGGWVDLV